MLIRRWHKTRRRWVWDVRIRDEQGKKRLCSTGHTSKKVAQEYDREACQSFRRHVSRSQEDVWHYVRADEYSSEDPAEMDGA